ncbi:NLRC3 [Symbiodinium necroappetens]|uniref:NLRC3 protein n=1 Tax=Symbiodinium necroappetens TaxID=1628268 RepID=A0A812VU86_9DINO|nr:NLRC3 [Symbiodinium necroappetens]
MSHMHMCYAHECNWTVSLEALTPDTVWDAALQNSEHLVMVYDDESKTVRGRPLKELVHNRVPYRDRGWCKAEVEWSSCRSRSEQNQLIDPRDSEVNSASELAGKVPTAPEVFQEDMKKAAFTHRNDAGIVQKLQQDIYYKKVSACEEALLTNLPEGELGRLAKALKDYRKLKVLRLRNIAVGEAEAEEFCKALGLNDTIAKLEIHALADALKSNKTVTDISLDGNWIGHEGAKALADSLNSNNCTVTHVNLGWKDEGAKALVDALKSNRTVTVNLGWNKIGDFTKILGKGAKDNEESAKHSADATKSQAWTGKVRIQALASQLTTNSGTTRLVLVGNLWFGFPGIAAEDCQALAAALKLNCTVTRISLIHCKIGDEGAKALADALKTNKTVTNIYLGTNGIGPEGAKALADALKSNCTVTHVYLKNSKIGDEGAKAIADALNSNCTVTHVDLRNNKIGAEGAKARRCPQGFRSLQFRPPLSCERHSQTFGSSTMLSTS